MRSDYTNAARSKLHAVLQHVALYTLWTKFSSLYIPTKFTFPYIHTTLS